jgi:hypothetical protein
MKLVFIDCTREPQMTGLSYRKVAPTSPNLPNRTDSYRRPRESRNPNPHPRSNRMVLRNSHHWRRRRDRAQVPGPSLPNPNAVLPIHHPSRGRTRRD